MPTFGDQVRRLSKQKRIPLKAVAIRAGLSYGFTWRLMRSYHDPTLSVVLRIAAALEVKPSVLIDGVEPVRRNGAGPGYPKVPVDRTDVRVTRI